ncbi:MAG: hypothetical protein WBE74_00020, partial [Terracidiphilus sp.]
KVSEKPSLVRLECSQEGGISKFKQRTGIKTWQFKRCFGEYSRRFMPFTGGIGLRQCLTGSSASGITKEKAGI